MVKIFILFWVYFNRGIIRSKKSAIKINQSPMPIAYDSNKIPPWIAVPEVAARVSETPSIGPTHGDHATAKVTPIRNERKYELFWIQRFIRIIFIICNWL